MFCKHIYIINSQMCLSVGLWLPKWLGRFQKFLAGNCIWVGDGYFFLEKFFFRQNFFFQFFLIFSKISKNFLIFNFFENFQIFIFFKNFRKFLKIFKFKKNSCQKFCLRKKSAKRKFAVEQAKPRVPRVYSAPKAPSM